MKSECRPVGLGFGARAIDTRSDFFEEKSMRTETIDAADQARKSEFHRTGAGALERALGWWRDRGRVEDGWLSAGAA